ncbi:uncharacterized protein BP5553_06867 [Venustampulla echinocandica]|uniref:Uncharacterized protein n=1 Tax=Venustampulla echinocandica TaxID=2656787 RepID=A0A370TL64_9HELO|nr:uncharacterized protein BP5553_06867 [Venustampulla echinocandica]RDL36255.1 hypothetical protein BP5553_06867 [Venustampulla echinocandica]
MPSRRLSGDVTESYILHLIQSSPKRASTSPNTEDGIIPWGFGFEFESCLQAKWQDVLEQQEARLKKYSPFGMDADDARQPTPEDMREAYRQFIESELDDVHTPSPSPSRESMPRGPVQSVECRRPGYDNNSPHRGSAPKNRNGGHGIRTERKDDKIAPVGIKKRRKRGSARSLQNRSSTHPMETRSRKRATIST